MCPVPASFVSSKARRTPVTGPGATPIPVSDPRTATFAWVGTEGLKASQAFDTLSIAKHLHQPQASHRSDRSGPQGTFTGSERADPPSPGPNPGMAEHAPSQGKVVAGEGPGAEHRFFAFSNYGQRTPHMAPRTSGTPHHPRRPEPEDRRLQVCLFLVGRPVGSVLPHLFRRGPGGPVFHLDEMAQFGHLGAQVVAVVVVLACDQGNPFDDPHPVRLDAGPLGGIVG